MLEDILKKCNFTEKEAKVYLVALELGQAPVSSIARRSRENRVTTYSCLKSLKQKGVIFEHKQGNTAFYSVLDPQQLLSKEQEKIRLFESKLPEFLALANTHVNKPKILFFEGEQAIEEQYYDLFSSTNDEICSFFTCQNFKASLNHRLEKEFLPQRIAHNIPVRVIMKKELESEFYTSRDDKELLRQLLIIDDIPIDLNCNIDIYAQNKVSIVLGSDKELTGIIIQSEKFYKTMKALFNLIRKLKF